VNFVGQDARGNVLAKGNNLQQRLDLLLTHYRRSSALDCFQALGIKRFSLGARMVTDSGSAISNPVRDAQRTDSPSIKAQQRRQGLGRGAAAKHAAIIAKGGYTKASRVKVPKFHLFQSKFSEMAPLLTLPLRL
jgi:hypothetical protein